MRILVTGGAGFIGSIDWYRRHEAWWRKLEWMKVVPVRTAAGETEDQ